MGGLDRAVGVGRGLADAPIVRVLRCMTSELVRANAARWNRHRGEDAVLSSG
jgi:hypothetical protein